MKAQITLTPRGIVKAIEGRREEMRKHGVRTIGLFGSFLKGTSHEKSDLDFIVAFNKPGFDNYMDTKFMLEKLFGRKVDLVTERSIKPALKYVKKEAFYAKI